MSTDVFQMSERHGMNWFTTIILVLFHIGAIAALFMFSWRSLAVAIFLYWLATGVGISMGYHRLHTHRSYKVPLLARILLCCLRHVDARRRTDLLGSHAPDPSSEVRSAGRPALTARRRLVGAYGLDSLRRDQSQQYAADVASMRPIWRSTASTSG